MRKQFAKITAALVLAAAVLPGSASALFGKKEAPADPAEGAPTTRDMEIRTYQDISYEAQFLAYDGEGDEMTFAVVEEPKKGAVAVEGDRFIYTPKAGFSGRDRFTYAATDSAGHVSLPAAVAVTVEKVRSGVTYADTDDAASAAAAQYLAEEGIFTGAKIGEHYYFEPEREVSRSEFLAMVLETADREITGVTMTGFCDDESIPVWAKGYAAAAVTDGILQGRHTAEGTAFRGGESITFNEAATVLNRVLNLGDVDLDEWYADRETAPSWAAQAVGNMEAFSVLAAGSFGSRTMEQPVTRADAARMLSAADTLLEGGEESGLLSWLR